MALVHRRAWLATALFSVLALPMLCAARGSYPSRPIVMIVPQAAGGTNDIVGRLVSQKLGEVMAASVVVENRPGAGGNIGTQAVARDRKSTRLNSSHIQKSRMPSSA